MWSRAQQYRLAVEQQILAHELAQFTFHNLTGDTYVSGWQGTAGGDRDYLLKLVLGPGYPDRMPSLYVVSPITLRTYRNRSTINAMGLSHRFHVLGTGLGGCVEICHTKPELWDAAMTCTAVLMKGIVWLEAYEAHRRTGRDLCEFCVSSKSNSIL